MLFGVFSAEIPQSFQIDRGVINQIDDRKFFFFTQAIIFRALTGGNMNQSGPFCFAYRQNARIGRNYFVGII